MCHTAFCQDSSSWSSNTFKDKNFIQIRNHQLCQHYSVDKGETTRDTHTHNSTNNMSLRFKVYSLKTLHSRYTAWVGLVISWVDLHHSSVHITCSSELYRGWTGLHLFVRARWRDLLRSVCLLAAGTNDCQVFVCPCQSIISPLTFTQSSGTFSLTQIQVRQSFITQPVDLFSSGRFEGSERWLSAFSDCRLSSSSVVQLSLFVLMWTVKAPVNRSVTSNTLWWRVSDRQLSGTKQRGDVSHRDVRLHTSHTPHTTLTHHCSYNQCVSLVTHHCTEMNYQSHVWRNKVSWSDLMETEQQWGQCVGVWADWRRTIWASLLHAAFALVCINAEETGMRIETGSGGGRERNVMISFRAF